MSLLITDSQSEHYEQQGTHAKNSLKACRNVRTSARKYHRLDTWQLHHETNNGRACWGCQHLDRCLGKKLFSDLCLWPCSSQLCFPRIWYYCGVLCVESWFYCFTGFHLIRFSFVVHNWPWERRKPNSLKIGLENWKSKLLFEMF